MGQHELPRAGGGHPLRQRCRGVVGQMAPVPQDALLEIVGIRPGQQPVLVVVALQHQQIHALQRLLGLRRDAAGVRQNAQCRAAAVKAEVDALRRVVTGGEHRHLRVPQCEHPLPGQQVQHIGGVGYPGAQRPGRAAGGVQRQAILLGQRGQPRRVVAVLMGHQHTGDVAGRQPQRQQRGGDAPGGNAGVHQNMCAAGADQQAVALGAAGYTMYCQQWSMSSL